MPKQKNPFEIHKIRKSGQAEAKPAGALVKRALKHHKLTIRRVALVVLTILAMGLVYRYQDYAGHLFKASVLETPPPFTGTVYPVEKVPDWTNWKGNNSTTLYNDIPASQLVLLPKYDPEKMQFPDDQLIWGNKQHDEIRNLKITYPVVYLGNYELDHEEHKGSHLAVDIKMPVGTPVRSIASGRVTKVSMDNGGFGHHVVIELRNVPDPDNPTKKTTLHVGFNHMDEIYVSEGQIASKGEIIGTSGNTGTSTTPHLHFQIDRDSAPWHPYWPFSWAESQAAGLSFFDAVNAGLGLSNAKANTVSPMDFVADNLNYSGIEEKPAPTPPPSEPVPEPVNKESTVTSQPSAEEEPVPVVTTPDNKVDTSLFSFKISGEPISMVGSGVTLTVTDSLNQIQKMSDTDEVRVNLTGVGRVSKKSFSKADFKDNVIQFIVNSSEVGKTHVEVGKSVFDISFIDQISPVASFAVEHDGNYQKGQFEVIKVIALDTNGSPTPVVNFGGSVEIKAKEGAASFTPDRIAVSDFKNGIAEIRMQVNNEERVIVRAQGGALVGESEAISAEPLKVFGDVDKNNPHYDAIKYLEEYNIIGGYPDGTFRPNDTVNRVEALKMLMLAFDIQAGPAGELPFADTENSAWYSGTLATAVAKGIVKGYEDGTFKPGSTVNKAEYLKMLFLTNGIVPTENLSANPYDDVPKDAWYAPYAYLLNKKNLLDVQSRLEAGNGMTRGDVAETIFRMKYLLENDLLSYSK